MKTERNVFAKSAPFFAAAVLFALPGAAAAARAPAAPAPVPVLLSSSPDNAAVSVDGAPRGTTPVQTTLAPGRHVARLEAPGLPPTFAEFESGDAPSERFFELPRPAVPVLVDSVPRGASVTLDGASVGTTPLLLPSVEPGRRAFGFALAGFKPQQRETVLAAPGPARVSADLEPSTATIAVDSSPRGATVSVDGAPRGATPLEIAGVAESGATVEVSAPGHEPWRTATGPLQAGAVFRIDAVLVPLPATVEVVTVPSGARIYLDGAFAGFSPLVATNAAAGQRRLRADLEGHASVARTVELVPGKNPVQEFRLRQTGGHLFLSTAPAGADVSVDGRVRGRTSGTNGVADAVSGVFAVSNLAAGPHKLSVSRPGWETKTADFTIGEGVSATLETIELVRKFIPDFQIETRSTGVVRGVFVEKTADHYRIEVSPGVVRAVPKAEIIRVAILRHGREAAED